MELVVLIGLQASGKSTFRRRFDGSHTVVSKDLLRSNRRRSRRQTQLIEAALSSGQSVVVDNTNPRVQDRAELVAQAKCHGARVVAYYFPSSVRDALESNAARTGCDVVPTVAILSTARILQPPSYAEGFDELYLVCRADSAFSVQTYLEDERGCG